MASRKPTTIPAAKVEDLFELRIGSTTMKFWKPAELTPRQSRELNIQMSYLSPKLRAASRAAAPRDEKGDPIPDAEIDGRDIGLTLEETRQLFELNDLAAVVYLKSWTLRRSVKVEGTDGVLRTIQEPWPLPEVVDDLLDLPGTIYDALVGQAAKIASTEIADGTTVASVENPDSPTGASGD